MLTKLSKLKLLTMTLIMLMTSGWLLHWEGRFCLSEWVDTKYGNDVHRLFYSLRTKLDPCFQERSLPYTSKHPLDVLIPMVEKDLITAKEVIKSIRSMIFHPIGTIYIVAPESAKIRDFCKTYECTYVLENQAVENYEDLRQYGGWMIQQFIKLNADKICKNEHILIVDADTVFLRPQVFLDNKNIYHVNIHYDYAPLRKAFTRRLLNQSTYYRADFVTHHMLFKKEWLKGLKKEIAEQHNVNWQQAVVNLLQNEQIKYGFSEYDIYMTYVLSHTQADVRVVSNANTIIHRDRFDKIDEYKTVYSQRFKSASSHHFINFGS